MQPNTDTQPKRPANAPNRPPQQPPQSEADRSGPGCLAWGLLALAGGAFSLLVVFVAAILGYLNGQTLVEQNAVGTQQAFINEQLTTWIPRDMEAGNVVLLGARIEGLASLTPAPQEIAGLIATGTQFALDNQPTVTPTPTSTFTPAPSATTTVAAPTATTVSVPTTPPQTPTGDDPDAPLFDVETLFAEAEAQMAAEDYEEAVLTLDAVSGLDPDFRPAEVEALLFQAWETRARMLLRSGDPANLAAGIRAATEASAYGDIGELSYESYIAGLYLDAQSREALNPQGAITVYNNIYTQSPGYLDVRTKLYTLNRDLGDALYEAFDFCPAAQRYVAALAIQPGDSSTEQKLQAAQGSCDSGQPPAGAVTGEAPATGDESGEDTPPPATATPSGPAPIGQR